MNPQEKWFIMEWPDDGDPEVIVWFGKEEEAEKKFQEYTVQPSNSEIYLCEVKRVEEATQ